MAKNDRQSRDQKRKAKLKKRSERSKKHESLAYSGQKYRTEEYVFVMHRTEIGIYESFVVCDRGLIDDDVESAIERLILQMRQGSLPLMTDTAPVTINAEGNDDLVIWFIRSNWAILARDGTLPSRDELIGVLRTILHSLSLWRWKNMHDQGYLQFLEGLMKKLGVRVEQVSADDPAVHAFGGEDAVRAELL